ncbi:MAG: hypothetical protein JG782_177 [Anaerophaga sp.]|uniref:DUF2764 family protein n=1 Tax=Anaerophaga thermohalophila TaxID=177400 RepID=UPI000237CE11|nr:DUF2764 family protein [Anaerophaga thermohalophila]MBZ4675558.1 hypothetical protein [Anaerophaga sp.]MDI3521299.1 hypothetical protein [Anaerophaga sp.]MDK2840758.1 hypothetical protein [Anaerophaga sp.]MDN5290751.1 hypothetical protein [Anaerophaga sp.]
MSKGYYCLVAGLPDLVPEEKKLTFSSAGFREMMKDELTPGDFALLRLFYLPFDHENLLNLFFNEKKEWDDRGNFSKEELEPLTDKKVDLTEELSQLPPYLIDFVLTIHGDEAKDTRVEASRKLSSDYYEYLESSKNLFVRKLAKYQRDTSNILTALNGRKYELDFEKALIGNDDVTNALKKSRVRDFGLKSEVEHIEDLLQIFEIENLKDRELRLDVHKWHFVEDATFFNYFTIERVLAFLQKLFIAERWINLDPEKGREMFEKLFNELKSGFEFPEEYTLTYGKKR